MLSLEDIRSYATGMPEVAEQLHFGRTGFRVRDKLFVSVHLDPGNPSAIVHVDQAQATAAAADDPDTYELVWRWHGRNRIFVGLRVDLAGVSASAEGSSSRTHGGTEHPSA